MPMHEKKIQIKEPVTLEDKTVLSELGKSIIATTALLSTIHLSYRKKLEDKQDTKDLKILLSLSEKILTICKQRQSYSEDNDILLYLTNQIIKAMNAYLNNRMSANSTSLYLLKQLHKVHDEIGKNSKEVGMHPVQSKSTTLFNQVVSSETGLAVKLNTLLKNFDAKKLKKPLM
jgi:hypothetical protein